MWMEGYGCTIQDCDSKGGKHFRVGFIYAYHVDTFYLLLLVLTGGGSVGGVVVPVVLALLLVGCACRRCLCFLSCVAGFVVLPVLSLFAVVFLVRRRQSVFVSEIDIGG